MDKAHTCSIPLVLTLSFSVVILFFCGFQSQTHCCTVNDLKSNFMNKYAKNYKITVTFWYFIHQIIPNNILQKIQPQRGTKAGSA